MKIKGFIEVTAIIEINYMEEGWERSRFEETLELINLNNIASVMPSGDLYLMRGYANGSHICRTKETYEEIKQLIVNAS